MQQVPGESLGRRWPWAVVRARRSHDPANPLRYSHTIKLAVAVLVVAVLLTLLAIPARTVESEMYVDVEAAKADGFPQLPPDYATDKQISTFIQKWNLVIGPDDFSREQISKLSVRVGEYGDDSALFNVGIMACLIAIAFISAAAFTRAMNNLYALGFEFSTIPPAWAVTSWFLPPLSFVLPWRVVAGVFSPVMLTAEGGKRSLSSPWRSVVSGVWGLSFVGLWLLNPVSVNMFIRANDIDGWLNRIMWTERMMVWLPITSFITAAVLIIVAVGQHRRYRVLEGREATFSVRSSGVGRVDR